MSETAPEKMKVTDLRSALQERGLDTKGTKPVLVARLQEALDKEKPVEEESAEVAEAEAGAGGDAEPMEEGDKPKVEEVKPEAEVKTETKKEDVKGVKRKVEEEPFEVKENEPEIADDLVCLDWYNSDLSLKISEDLCTALPFIRDGWSYCYAGARATHGFQTGKIWYEVKYIDNMDAKVEKEASTFDLRVGWSTNNADLMLGDAPNTWCYSSCQGNMASASKFEDYGEKYGRNDVIGAFLDIGEDEISMTFTKNGEDQGDAYQIPRSELVEGQSFFPHILTRNVKFQVNFGVDKKGEDVENWKEKLEGEYIKAGKAENKIRGTARIEKREDCEMIMMVGLPGAGKTHWVENHVKENPDKNYNVISTNEMFRKMTVKGELRKKVHIGKWDLVIQKATRSLQELIRTASARRRNIIIDQTNVFPNAQSRKARPFEGFQRRCVVVVPTDEQYKERVKSQDVAGNKDIPDEAIMEMKANFELPAEKGSPFNEILFVELDREKAQEVVDLYNKVAKEKGYGKSEGERRSFKKPRLSRGGSTPRGSFRGNFNPRGAGFRGRGGPPFRGGRGMRGAPYPGSRGNVRNGMGPSPWANKNQGSQGWGTWNQGTNAVNPMMAMNNMGGGMNGMGGGMNGMGMNGMGGGMNSMGGGMNGMGGGMNGMGMGGGMNSMGMGGMGGGMGGMGGGMGGMGGGMGGMGGGMGVMGGGMGGMGGGMSGMGGGMGGMGGGMSGMGMSSGMGSMASRLGGGMGGGMGSSFSQNRNSQSYGGGSSGGYSVTNKFNSSSRGGNRGSLSRGGGGSSYSRGGGSSYSPRGGSRGSFRAGGSRGRR